MVTYAFEDNIDVLDIVAQYNTTDSGWFYNPMTPPEWFMNIIDNGNKKKFKKKKLSWKFSPQGVNDQPCYKTTECK